MYRYAIRTRNLQDWNLTRYRCANRSKTKSNEDAAAVRLEAGKRCSGAAWGQPCGHARRRCPGVTLWYVVAACRSNYAALMTCIVAARAAWDSAHRFAAVLPLGAPSLGPDPSSEAVPGVTRVGDTPR